MADKMLEKIAAILNKAENTDNPHEREAFQAAAEKMAARNAIDLEVARQHTTDKNAKQAPIAENIVLGEKGERLVKSRINLFVKIGLEHGLRIYVHGDGISIDAFGMPSDIEMVKMFYAVLVVQMTEAGNEFISSGEYRRIDPKANAQVARSEFYDAFANKIGLRMREIRWREEREAARDYKDDNMSLVLASKKDEVNKGFRDQYGKTGVWKHSGSAKYNPHARRAGNVAGEKARLGGERQLSQGRGIRG
jgi:hypothetical protein